MPRGKMCASCPFQGAIGRVLLDVAVPFPRPLGSKLEPWLLLRGGTWRRMAFEFCHRARPLEPKAAMNSIIDRGQRHYRVSWR